MKESKLARADSPSAPKLSPIIDQNRSHNTTNK